MTTQELLRDLKKSPIPVRYHIAAIDLHHTWAGRDSARNTAATLLAVQAEMTPEARAAIHANLMALTPGLAAKQAGCHRKTIDRAIRAGQIAATHGNTGLVSLDKNSFEVWKQARRPKMT